MHDGSCPTLYSVHCKLPGTAYYKIRALQHHIQLEIVHIVQIGSCTNLDRCPLVCMVLYKVAWGQVVLSYICDLVCCYKRLDVYTYTACQGVYINVETFLESFLSIYFKIL